MPRTREALEALPGVGRKTANVVLNVAFGEPTIAVDTHIFRVGNRTGIATGKTPFEVETKLEEVVPAIQTPCASLADPARPLYLRRAQPVVRALRHCRFVQMAGQDNLDRAGQNSPLIPVRKAGIQRGASMRIEVLGPPLSAAGTSGK